MPDVMHQEAPYPQALRDLLDRFGYQPPGRKWTFRLGYADRGQGSRGLTLTINIQGPDSYDPECFVNVDHYMLVPPAAYDERSWTDWLFEQVGLVEQHERMEFFKVGGRAAYPPAHGPGNSPYLRMIYGTETDRRTSFRGELNPE